MTIAQDGARIASLDVVRGIAVMGILAMNIVAFAMPFQAYMNPAAFGMEGPADYWSWLISFILVDGKMRGLFSFLFGASTLLVIERAQAAGLSGAAVHYPRMIWLLVFGLIHFYFIWFGDILAGYALTGLVLYFFRNLSVRALVGWGAVFIVVQSVMFLGLALGVHNLAQAVALPDPDPAALDQWQGIEDQFGILSGQPLADKLALFRGAYSGLVETRLMQRTFEPLINLSLFGWETLAYMLLGMAALKSGLFKGEWPPRLYRRIAAIALAISVPAYGVLAWQMTRAGFSIPSVMLYSLAAPTIFRPIMVIGYVALIMLLARRGGAFLDRIAAAGRVAFTNYLGTSLIMTSLFYGHGLGLYGSMSRASLWLAVIAMWALMLLWSKPWLERFLYGPFEWLWRSLSRWERQPMRRIT